MMIGMLWLDTDKRKSPQTKIEEAAAYYQRKYGHIPTVCHVHPDNAGVEVDEIKILADDYRQPNEFCLFSSYSAETASQPEQLPQI